MNSKVYARPDVASASRPAAYITILSYHLLDSIDHLFMSQRMLIKANVAPIAIDKFYSRVPTTDCGRPFFTVAPNESCRLNYTFTRAFHPAQACSVRLHELLTSVGTFLNDLITHCKI